MSIRIQFDKPTTSHFTNLDFVTGRVILTLLTDTTISAVNVKLQGTFSTRLARPHSPQDRRSERKRAELEVHKLLYKVQTVFPTPQIQGVSLSSSSQFVLSAGQYDYPFSFKIPFNNSCEENSSLQRDLKLLSLNVPIAPDTNQHRRRALPPTLSGFPGEAEIKYYVKATVVRPKFYQENMRYQVDIRFLPIEPPRPSMTNEELFARRKHQFQKALPQLLQEGVSRKSSLTGSDEEPTIIQVDARLPSPAIITGIEPLPLRILVRRLNRSSASIYLSMLQIELIATTHIRAHDLTRTELSSWIITSQANMDMRLGNPMDKSVTEWKIPSHFWDNTLLPNTVPPTFETCNISRKYELEVRVGLTHGMATALRPELIVLPLRLPVKVYSGITPPASLLSALANQHVPSQPLHDAMAPNRTTLNSSHRHSMPVSPTSYEQTFPAQVGSFSHPVDADEPPPPSYEDAMAEDIGPLNGPGRGYNPPLDQSTSPRSPLNSSMSGSKGGGLRRHVSERLFPQNGPRSPDMPEPRRGSELANSRRAREESDVVGRTCEGIERPPPKPPRRNDTSRSAREV